MTRQIKETKGISMANFSVSCVKLGLITIKLFGQTCIKRRNLLFVISKFVEEGSRIFDLAETVPRRAPNIDLGNVDKC